MSHHPSEPAGHAPNRLASETSPYLLQHQHNPVDWYAWGDEALERARREDRPIFLSVGYSACHWCHVMERESFEDAAIAGLMNDHFVNIKVDREERPDLDQIYMAAVQAMTGRGGWPMSVFLTPDLRPFYGGTYFPPSDMRGMPGFPRVLLAVSEAWRERRDEILESAGAMVDQLRGLGQTPATPGQLDTGLLDHAAQALARSFEPRFGGFGSAPKFPHAMDLHVLLRQFVRTGQPHALHMVRHTLDRMAQGGIYDHLGGGFARYSTDDRWLVPHFEKMLYDNALLTLVYVQAHQVTRDPEYVRVARETIDYILGRMTGAEGAFLATEDADSEGVEGKYYVWTLDEITALLGAERARTFAAVYDITPQGNWEGHNILNLPAPLDAAAKKLGVRIETLAADLAADRHTLLEARARRVPPGKDTKVLVSWNGLMLSALAEAGTALGEPRYLHAAERAAGFLLDTMKQPDGRLWHAFTQGQARFNAYLDDYACLIDGLTRLFEATGTPRWIHEALALADRMIEQFHDAEGRGFYYTGKDHETLIVRQKDLMDNATPSGNGMAATALVRLAALTGDERYRGLARETLEAIAPLARQYPTAFGQSLIALDELMAEPREIALIGGNDLVAWREARSRIARRFVPGRVVAPAAGPVAGPLAETLPLLADRPALDGKVTAYLCTAFACAAPVTGLDAITEALG